MQARRHSADLLHSSALNISPTEKFADGLHAGEYETLTANLGEDWAQKFVRKPLLAIEYVSTRVQNGGQLEWYKVLQELVWAMIEEAFSERLVVPGETTTQDVVWWFRDKMEDVRRLFIVNATKLTF